mmetsp:Transcript_881/g.2026  ORF Transcript_881/g.2026 Transcript_881/m.2026 type:complete len:200 (-) Transcript_881:464-1063(-)
MWSPHCSSSVSYQRIYVHCATHSYSTSGTRLWGYQGQANQLPPLPMSHLDLPAAHWFRPFRSVHPLRRRGSDPLRWARPWEPRPARPSPSWKLLLFLLRSSPQQWSSLPLPFAFSPLWPPLQPASFRHPFPPRLGSSAPLCLPPPLHPSVLHHRPGHPRRHPHPWHSCLGQRLLLELLCSEAERPLLFSTSVSSGSPYH